MRNMILGLTVLLSSLTSFASGYECKDASKRIVYSYESSDGGACCGFFHTRLSHNGQMVKQVDVRRGFGGHDDVQDSNENLTIEEGTRTDLGSPSQKYPWRISHFSMRIQLTTADGSHPLPSMTSPAIVRMTCEGKTYIGPPRP